MTWKDIIKNRKPDYPDLDGDGDTEEPMVDALKTVEQVESVKKIASHTYGVELDMFAGIKNRLAKKLQDLDVEDFSHAETDEVRLELAIHALGKMLADAAYEYKMEWSNEDWAYNIDKKR